MRMEVYGCSGTNYLIFLKVVSPPLYVGEAMALWLVRWTRGRKLLERLGRANIYESCSWAKQFNLPFTVPFPPPRSGSFKARLRYLRVGVKSYSA